jgi:hypothetical protein
MNFTGTSVVVRWKLSLAASTALLRVIPTAVGWLEAQPYRVALTTNHELRLS